MDDVVDGWIEISDGKTIRSRNDLHREKPKNLDFIAVCLYVWSINHHHQNNGRGRTDHAGYAGGCAGNCAGRRRKKEETNGETERRGEEGCYPGELDLMIDPGKTDIQAKLDAEIAAADGTVDIETATLGESGIKATTSEGGAPAESVEDTPAVVEEQTGPDTDKIAGRIVSSISLPSRSRLTSSLKP